MVLIPAAVARLDIPVIASGGIANGAGLAAALALGAEGVSMGARFMGTTEAPIHDNVKQQIVANTERDTLLVFREFHNSAQVARNCISEPITKISKWPVAIFSDIAALASGARGRADVLGAGDLEGRLWWASMTQGLIHEVGDCADVVATVIDDATEIITKSLPALIS